MSNKQNIQETLVSMGFQKNYVVRGLKVYEKNYGHAYNIEVITEIICRLRNKDKAKKQRKLRNQPKPPNDNNTTNNMPSFTSHMTLEEAQKLRIHDKIDHRDKVGRFLCATVSEKQGTNLKIHYDFFGDDGWSRKWDTWSDFTLELHRFALAGSITTRPAHRFKQLKTGDFVDINPTRRHPGWKCSEIRKFDQTSGQVQLLYHKQDKEYLYWTHLDNENEIATFTSKTGTTHAIVTQIRNDTERKDEKEILEDAATKNMQITKDLNELKQENIKLKNESKRKMDLLENAATKNMQITKHLNELEQENIELKNENGLLKTSAIESKRKMDILENEMIQMTNNEKELEEKLLKLENEYSELKRINKHNNYAVDPIIEYKLNNKNDIKIGDDIVQKQSGIDNVMNVHVNRLSKWDEYTVNLQKEFEKIDNYNDEKKQQQNEMTIPVSDLLNSYITCGKWLKIQQARVEGIVEHVVLLSRSKKELKNIVKQYEENVKPTQQKYDELIASYTNLKSERIKLREKVSNMIQQINQITQEENKINKEKCEMLNNLHECVTEKEKYDQLLVKCKSLTTKYSEFENNIDAKVEELNHFFKQNWDNHEKIWWKWNVNDIICWLKYMIYSYKITSSQELDLNNVAKEMENQKFTGKCLPKIEKSDLKLFGIILFDDYQQIYKQIQIIIHKYPNIVDKGDIRNNNDVEGGVQITVPKVQIPEEFKCPISDQIMVDPIVYDGITYDRNNFMEYVQKHKTLPGSNEEYDEDEGLFKNRKLKQKIDVFLDVNPLFRIEGV